ncbi:MAG: FemAB family PEP-CTERM system-associated protein [Alphaproteobacteria bacterium]|nr:FemAB family PEP-CTERM system-associated protein [Alphaproteobacteria bacterium]MCB9929197.1 FemAB family PEP-CTERM system-associated protein [Alphaproteobacteria bacterium]
MAAAIAIARLDAADAAAWDAFVLQEPSATFFHRAGWARVIRRAYGYDTHFLMARRNGEIVGVLPLVHLKTLAFGQSLISMGFCVYGGIASSDPLAIEALAAEAARLGEQLGVGYVEMRSEQAQIPGWQTKSDVYATFRRELHDDDDANLKAIPRKKRADVRKGIKSDLTVDTSGDIDTFHAIYAESVRNLGTPVFSKRYIRTIAEEFGDDCEISVVHGPQGPVAALASFFFRDQVLPYYGGGTFAARPLHAYDQLYWTLMGRAVRRGARVFDFGRSKYGTGAFDYKTYWGFEPTPLRYQYHLVKASEVPDINPLNPKYRLFVAMWQKLPLPVANRVGPWVARQLG